MRPNEPSLISRRGQRLVSLPILTQLTILERGAYSISSRSARRAVVTAIVMAFSRAASIAGCSEQIQKVIPRERPTRTRRRSQPTWAPIIPCRNRADAPHGPGDQPIRMLASSPHGWEGSDFDDYPPAPAKREEENEGLVERYKLIAALDRHHFRMYLWRSSVDLPARPDPAVIQGHHDRAWFAWRYVPFVAFSYWVRNA